MHDNVTCDTFKFTGRCGCGCLCNNSSIIIPGVNKSSSQPENDGLDASPSVSVVSTSGVNYKAFKMMIEMESYFSGSNLSQTRYIFAIQNKTQMSFRIADGDAYNLLASIDNVINPMSSGYYAWISPFAPTGFTINQTWNVTNPIGNISVFKLGLNIPSTTAHPIISYTLDYVSGKPLTYSSDYPVNSTLGILNHTSVIVNVFTTWVTRNGSYHGAITIEAVSSLVVPKQIVSNI
jgi:hypothetical protein